LTVEADDRPGLLMTITASCMARRSASSTPR
jgi:hypothetical protein